MHIELYDINEMIKANDLKEVTDPVLFIRAGIPSSEGLLSNEIFGITIKSRKSTFAYIDLHGYLINPYIYKQLKRLDRRFVHIVNSTKKYTIVNGELIENEEKGGTGIKFLYDNWEKINLKKNNSLARNERVDMITRYKKNVLFCDKWLVLPVFYRDVKLDNSSNGLIKHAPINDKYSKMMRLAMMRASQNTFDIVLSSTESSMQELLVEIYDFFKMKLEKKHGIIRQNLLGKSTDYAVRSVISAPQFHAERPEELFITLDTTGVPLAQCCVLFNPFIVGQLKRTMAANFSRVGNKFPKLNKKGEISEFVELDDPMRQFTDDIIKKQIDNFVHSYSNRFIPIEVPIKNSKEKTYLRFIGQIYDKNDPVKQTTIDRPVTWCDLFYQAAVDVTQDKHVYITRYPLLDYFGSYPSKIHVLSTFNTSPTIVNGRTYPHYPVIDLNKTPDEIAASFADTVTPSNLLLKGLDGDYDGDMITIKALYTQEANLEAANILKSKAFLLNSAEENMRTTDKEGIQTLYALTQFE